MIEGIISILPVEFKPISVISLLLFAFVFKMIRDIQKNEKALRNEFEKARDGLNKKTDIIMTCLKVDIAETKKSIENINITLKDLKKDIREIRRSTK